jgi:cold shock CspA family protein
MTGIIKSLDTTSASGVITAEDGLIVGFLLSAVLAYDLPVLVVGQVVSFDLEGGRHPKALNVYVQGPHPSINAQGGHLETARLRYIGFEHRGNMRAYMFERLSPGSEKRTFTVDADLTLFAKHHVRMQDGPALCLHFLAEELNVAGAAAWTSCQCSLTDREMLAHLASLPVARAKHGFKRAPHSPGAASHVV